MHSPVPSLESINSRRHALAGLATLCVLSVLTVMGRPIPPVSTPKPALSAMEIVLDRVAAPPESVRPPDPAPARLPTTAPRAAHTSALPAQTTTVADAPAAVHTTPSTTAAPPAHAAPTAEARPQAPPEPPPSVAAPAVAQAPSASAEASFVAQLRALLHAAKRYPTGREASLQRPTGKVTLWFILARNGQLGEAGIEDSSNSILLDNAALSTLRRTSFPALPEAAWPGAPSHRFTVTLDFVAPS